MAIEERIKSLARELLVSVQKLLMLLFLLLLIWHETLSLSWHAARDL